MASITAISASYGETLHHCVACGGKNIYLWRIKHFQYTERNTKEAFHIHRCANCGTGFLNQPPHKKWLQAIYQYSGQALTKPITIGEVLAREVAFPNCAVDARRMSHQADQINLSGNKAALDVGSGFGFYTQALRNIGYRTVSINPAKYENEVFQEMNGDSPIPVILEDFKPTESFGVVIMSQVLEHILEPDQTIKKASALLSQGGVLACAVPNFDSIAVKLMGSRDNACLWVPEHVNYFTVDGLKALLIQHGFHIVKVGQITRIPSNALSKRLGLEGKWASFVNALVKPIQVPFASLMNLLGVGIYINIYAVKGNTTSNKEGSNE
ncbi:MAG: class I SAM-dependent methyltransferase [Proteobacteria bacterium]|nr:class I SAM-dependent methyltransferase [Pseudomonadota bacterium]